MNSVSDSILNATSASIEDPVFIQLAAELDLLVNFNLDRDRMVLHHLTQALYPMGAGDGRYKIDGKLIDPMGVLDTKLAKLRDSAIFEICDGLAQIQGESVELYVNKKVYVCLNKLIPNHEKKRRKYTFHPRDIPSI